MESEESRDRSMGSTSSRDTTIRQDDAEDRHAARQEHRKMDNDQVEFEDNNRANASSYFGYQGKKGIETMTMGA